MIASGALAWLTVALLVGLPALAIGELAGAPAGGAFYTAAGVVAAFAFAVAWAAIHAARSGNVTR